MGADLYKVQGSRWAVKFRRRDSKELDPEVEVGLFENIEQAADFLEKDLGVVPDQVDEAIMFMAGQGHTHANFGVNGSFIGSDNENFNQFGIA